MCILTIKMLDEIIRIKNRILCRVKIKIKIYIKFYCVLKGGMGKLEQRGFDCETRACGGCIAASASYAERRPPRRGVKKTDAFMFQCVCFVSKIPLSFWGTSTACFLTGRSARNFFYASAFYKFCADMDLHLCPAVLSVC